MCSNGHTQTSSLSKRSTNTRDGVRIIPQVIIFHPVTINECEWHTHSFLPQPVLQLTKAGGLSKPSSVPSFALQTSACLVVFKGISQKKIICQKPQSKIVHLLLIKCTHNYNPNKKQNEGLYFHWKECTRSGPKLPPNW